MEDRKFKILFIALLLLAVSALVATSVWKQAQSDSSKNRTPASQTTSAPEIN